MIDTPEALERLVRTLGSARAIAFDTEGDGLYRYRARLCTLQFAYPGGVAIVDALALPDRGPLAAILGDDGPEKVLHDCAFDARLLARAGLPLARVFDTAIAARFLGEVSTGLAPLLEKHLGVRIGKELQRADWGERPLDPERIAYLEQDVRHLLPLADVLRQRCAELDILDEVREESAWAARARDADDEAALPPWTRIEGAADLRSGTQRAILRELALLRERVAEQEDVPAHRVLPNALLLTLARRAPRDMRALEGTSLFERRPDLARDVLDAVRRGLRLHDAPAEELLVLRPPAPAPEERARRKRRERALGAWRQAEADARGVGPQVVLPGHCLRDLAARGARDEADLRAIAGLGEKRIERYGRGILAALAEADG